MDYNLAAFFIQQRSVARISICLLIRGWLKGETVLTPIPALPSRVLAAILVTAAAKALDLSVMRGHTGKNVNFSAAQSAGFEHDLQCSISVCIIDM